MCEGHKPHNMSTAGHSVGFEVIDSTLVPSQTENKEQDLCSPSSTSVYLTHIICQMLFELLGRKR